MVSVDGKVDGTTEKRTLAGRILEATFPLSMFLGNTKLPERKPYIVVVTENGGLENFPKDKYDFAQGDEVRVCYEGSKKTCFLKKRN